MQLFDAFIDAGPFFGIVFRPFDLLYTRMQSSLFLYKKQRIANPNMGVLETAKEIMNKEGTKGFFKGFACKLLKTAVSITSLLGVVPLVLNSSPQFLQFFVSCVSLIYYPFKHTQLHLMNNNAPQMRTIASQMRMTYQLGGLTQFYRGFFQQAFHYQIFIPLWIRWINYYWVELENTPTLKYLTLALNCSLFITTKHLSGTIWKNYVMETISTHRSRTSFHCYKRMRDTGGIQSLFRGFSMQLIPLSITMFLFSNPSIQKSLTIQRTGREQ